MLRLKTEDGVALLEFKNAFDEETDQFKGIYLEDCEDGKRQFDLDRALIVTATEE